jgi:hypothetical protein
MSDEQQSIDIKGLDKAAVLAALYNNSMPQGLGFLHFKPEPMKLEEARVILAASAPRFYFDYLIGRVIKVNLSDDKFDPWLYDRDNGQGAAARAVELVRK